ncbi:MAG: hypothetical protein ACP6KW_12710, partial [Candidatus Thorarchaeota archaeon]
SSNLARSTILILAKISISDRLGESTDSVRARAVANLIFLGPKFPCRMETIVAGLYTDTESVSEEEIRRSVKRKIKVGMVLVSSLALMPIVAFLIQYSVPHQTLMLIIILMAIVGMSGAVVLLYFGGGYSLFFRGVDTLHLVTPPEPFFEGKIAVVNRDPVYVVAQWGSNVVFFVAFTQSERLFERKVSLPRVIWKWEYTHQIGEIKVARRVGRYAIPTGRGVYREGEGILYGLLLERTSIVRVFEEFTTEQLIPVIDALAAEVSADLDSYQEPSDIFE